MKITRVETFPLEPRFKGDGYAMSMGRQTVLCHRLLRLTADDGTVGVSEFVRPPTWSVAEIEAIEDDCLPALRGLDLTDPIDTDRSMISRPEPGRVCAAPGPGLGIIPETLFPALEGGQ